MSILPEPWNVPSWLRFCEFHLVQFSIVAYAVVMITYGDVPREGIDVGQVVHPPPGGVEAWVVDRENPVRVDVIAHREYKVTHVTSAPRAHGRRDVILVLVVITPIPNGDELQPYNAHQVACSFI